MLWLYRYGTPTTPSQGTTDRYPEDDLGWDHDNENWLMGLLMVFRYGTAQQKVEALAFVARRYYPSLNAMSTPAEIIQHIRSSTFVGTVASRRSSFDGEFELLV